MRFHPADNATNASRVLCLHLAILCLSISPAVLHTPEAADTALCERSQVLRVCIECPHCDFGFIRSEVAFGNHVRDRHDVQVQILIPTASRGHQHSITAIGREEFIGNNDTLVCVTGKADTEDIIRWQRCERPV